MNPTSAVYWYPIVKDLVPTPRTIIIPFKPELTWQVIDGEPMNELPIEEIAKACEKIGYPCFFRTDFASAKQDGPNSYLITQESDINTIVYKTLEDNVLKDQEPTAFMVREFLELFSPFKAFGGLPIAREFRFFTKYGKNICHHYYWPEGAIKFYRPKDEIPGWKYKLRVLGRDLDRIDYITLSEYARDISSRLEGKTWSIDFAQDENCKWYMIDAAEGFKSWHPTDCPYYKDLRIP